MPLPADRAAAGPGPPSAARKGEAATQAGIGLNDQLHPLATDGPVDMLQVVIDLFFHNAHGLGNLPGVAFLLPEQVDDLLADGLHALLPGPGSNNPFLALLLIDKAKAAADRGKISPAEAKKQVLARLEQLRREEGTGYVWVNDTTTPIPSTVMLPPPLN